MVDRSIFAICSQNLQLRYGWMVSGFEKNATLYFFGGRLWRLFLPTFFCVEPFFWAYLELISSQLHQIQRFRRLFLRISMSQVDQAQQNHTSADSQHEKQLWWDWGKHNANKLIPSRKTCWKAWFPSCKVRIANKKWSNKVDHLQMDEGWSDDPSFGGWCHPFSGFPSTVRKVSSFQIRTPKIPKGITKISVVKVIITEHPPDATEQKFHGIAMVSCKMTNKSTGEKKHATSSHEENVRSGVINEKDLAVEGLDKNLFYFSWVS